MKIKFENIKEAVIPDLQGGVGNISASMFFDAGNMIMTCRIPVGASIGYHLHDEGSEMNYIIRGKGKAVCDGAEELLSAGECHYCPKGSSHSMENVGDEELELFAVVARQ